MTGTAHGRWKSAAAQIGIAYEQYAAHRGAGERWCWGCRTWKMADAFRERRRGSGIRHAQCRECHRERMGPLMRRRYHGYAVAGPGDNHS